MSRTNATVAILVGALIAALIAACGDHDQMRTSVVLCESAAQHIKKCCGAAPPGVSCEYSYSPPDPDCGDPQCNASETLPDFSEASASCIIATGCVQITGIGACTPSASDGSKAADRIVFALGCQQ